MFRIGLAAAIALALVGGGCGNGRSATSTSRAFDGAAYPTGVRAPDFTLPDLGGHAVSLRAQRGHVVALVFMPGDCRTCVLVAEQIRGALDELESSRRSAGANVRAILASTAPRSTTPARTKAFLSRTSLLGRVSYLSASEARLRPIWSAYHVTPPSAGQTAAEDAITVLLIDKRGSERVGFGIEQITPESLSHDIRLLEGE